MKLKKFVFSPAANGYFDPPYFTKSLLITYATAFQFKLMKDCVPALPTLPFA